MFCLPSVDSNNCKWVIHIFQVSTVAHLFIYYFDGNTETMLTRKKAAILLFYFKYLQEWTAATQLMVVTDPTPVEQLFGWNHPPVHPSIHQSINPPVRPSIHPPLICFRFTGKVEPIPAVTVQKSVVHPGQISAFNLAFSNWNAGSVELRSDEWLGQSHFSPWETLGGFGVFALSFGHH